MTYRKAYGEEQPKARSNNVLVDCTIGIDTVAWYSDLLRAGLFGDQTPVGAKFSAPVKTGPGAHPNFYRVGTGSLSRG